MPPESQSKQRARTDVADEKRAEIGLCLLLASADGEFSDAEVGALADRLGALLGELVSPLVLADVLAAEMASLDTKGPDDYVAALATRIPPGSRSRALRNALRVAHADGLSADEREAFREAAVALGLDEPRIVAMLETEGRYESDVPPWSPGEPPADS